MAAKFKPLLGHSWCNQGFLQRFAGRKFKTFVHTISCIDLFISDEEMNGCFWQSCLILQSVLGVVVRGLPLLFKGERLRFCLFLCNIRLTDASESFNRFEISTFL